MKYELAQNQPAEDKAIIERILGGEKVYGAFLRGTGKIYSCHEIHVITLTGEHSDKGKLALSAGLNTHNGPIQERFSRLICEWCPACDRANEINRGAPMTDAEKAEMKRRRLIGTLAANLEQQEKNVLIYQARVDEVAMFTPYQYALAETGWDEAMLNRVLAKEPLWAQYRYDSRQRMNTDALAYTHKLIAKIKEKQAKA